MNKWIPLCALSLLITFSNSYAYTTIASGFENLHFVKEKLIRYHDSGQYEREIASVDNAALQYLKFRITKTRPGEKLAIVLDIDETSLSNYPDMLAMDFGGTLPQIDAAIAKGEDKAIAPTLEFYRYAKAHNIAVFFVTGRKEMYQAMTIRNLEDVGYKNFTGLILKPQNYHEKSVIPYKSSARRMLAKQGYTIILNIGDQNSDLAGGYAEKAFKLPDPYYYIP